MTRLKQLMMAGIGAGLVAAAALGPRIDAVVPSPRGRRGTGRHDAPAELPAHLHGRSRDTATSAATAIRRSARRISTGWPPRAAVDELLRGARVHAEPARC